MASEDILAGHLITKEKRQELFGKVDGGSGSTKIEKYQRLTVVQKTGLPCPKTHVRINLRKNILVEISQPNTQITGFDYSEDFDGVQKFDNKTVYLNFKCIAGKGGVQTRSLREVYWFIQGQLNSLATISNVYFANILDGDEAHSNMAKFEYILSEFADVRDKVYIGDLRGYFDWVKKIRCSTM